MDVSKTWEELKRPIWESSLLEIDELVPSEQKQEQLPTGGQLRGGVKLTVSEALKQSKTNIKSRHPIVSGASRTNRAAEMEAKRKTKRLDTHLANRGISKEGIVGGMNPSANKDTGIKATMTTMSTTLMSTTSTSTTSSEPSGIEMTTTSDARKKMLQKWKQEKTAMQTNKPVNNKPAFKPGGGATIPPPPPVSSIRQKPLPTVKVVPTVQPPQVERRVTRGMAKVTNNSAATLAKGDNNKQISQQMKSLTINNNGGMNRNAVEIPPAGKKPAQAENKPPTSRNKGVQAKAGVSNLNSDTKNKNGVSSAVGKAKPGTQGVSKTSKTNKKQEKMEIEPEPLEQSQNNIMELQTAQKDPPISKMEVVSVPAVPKKLKPQAIDSVYIEYTSTFGQAIKQLQSFSKYWRPLVDNNALEIPENIRDEIISSLGKVQLLLGSKLPQFAELLHSYLCKEISPFPILECDLQGWWDVAAIQVSQVCSDFEKLKELEANQWTRRPEVVSKVPEQQKKERSGSNGSKLPVVKAKAQASKGMQAFLAMKRQATQQRGSGSATSETSVDSTSSGGTPQDVDKKFEGGFFVISSPARTNGTLTTKSDLRRVSLRTHGKSTLTPNILPRTPGTAPARRLSTNLSLRSLSLRNSMGPMYKLGAKGDANSDELISTPK